MNDSGSDGNGNVLWSGVDTGVKNAREGNS